MTDDDLIALPRDISPRWIGVTAILSPTRLRIPVLIIETHNIIHDGKQAICALFESRWTVPSDRMVKARHQDVIHSPSQSSGRITSQFTVTYSGPDAPPPKSNANVFSMRDGKITRISVYMACANSIKP